MATNDLTANAAERMDIALQATWQLHGLFKGLFAQTTAIFDMPERMEQAAVIRALAIREDRLMHAMLDMLGDSLASCADAQEIVAEGHPSEGTQEDDHDGSEQGD